MQGAKQHVQVVGALQKPTVELIIIAVGKKPKPKASPSRSSRQEKKKHKERHRALDSEHRKYCGKKFTKEGFAMYSYQI